MSTQTVVNIVRVDYGPGRRDVVVVHSLDAGDLAPRQGVYRCPIELHTEALGLKGIDGVLGIAVATGTADRSTALANPIAATAQTLSVAAVIAGAKICMVKPPYLRSVVSVSARG